MPRVYWPGIRIWSLGCATLLLGSGALAQSQSPEPVAANRGFSANFDYRSPLEGYRAYAAQDVQAWRESNDTVGRIGGWRAYAKEAEAGALSKPEGAGGATDPHAGHHGGKQ